MNAAGQMTITIELQGRGEELKKLWRNFDFINSINLFPHFVRELRHSRPCNDDVDTLLSK